MQNLQGGEQEGDQVQGTVLEPCKVAVSMDMTQGSGDVNLKLSDLRLNVSPDVLELALSLQTSVLEPLFQPAPDRFAGLFTGVTGLPVSFLLTGCDLLEQYNFEPVS